MTVSSTNNTRDFDGDGVTVNFPTRQFLVNDDTPEGGLFLLCDQREVRD